MGRRPKATEREAFLEKAETPEEVRNVIFLGEIIEDYPEDVRGHSCLMLGLGMNQRPIHVVCSPKDEYLAVVTVYLPDNRRWQMDWKTRKSHP